jgi:Bardet-Biedl syndrome 2 protein
LPKIRVFRNEELLCEITEADKVTFLASLSSGPGRAGAKGAPVAQTGASTNRFAYGLANGTVGVYSGSKTRMWRVKTKNKVTALHTYDLDMDGNNEVFTGWSNGSFTVRRQETGEVIFKDSLDAPVAGIVSCDYRQTGSQEVLLVSESGEVRAYMSTDVDFGALYERGFARDNLTDQKALGDLQKQKLDLTNELRKLEKSLKSGGGKPGDTPVGSLPSSTSLSYSVEADIQQRAVMLKVEVRLVFCRVF